MNTIILMIKGIFFVLLLGFVSICRGEINLGTKDNMIPSGKHNPEGPIQLSLDTLEIQMNLFGDFGGLIIIFISIIYLIFLLNDILIYGIFLKKNFSWKIILKEVVKIHSISYFRGTSLFLIILFILPIFGNLILTPFIPEINLITGEGFAERERVQTYFFGISILVLISVMLLFLFGKKKMIQNSFQISPKKGLLIAFIGSIMTAGMAFLALIILVDLL